MGRRVSGSVGLSILLTHFPFPLKSFTGSAAALSSISGPIEVRLAAENPSQATFEVLLRPLSNVPGTESKALASTIRNLLTPSIILTQNPRTLVQLVVQALIPAEKFYSPLVASIINASTLALMNAGSIPMRGIVCAVSVGRFRSNSMHTSTLILDPSDDELSSLQGIGCFAFLFGTGQKGGSEVVWSNWQSSTSFSEEELISARNLARGGAEKVWMGMKQSVGRVVDTKPSAVQTQSIMSVAAEEDESSSEDDSDDNEMKL
jgi:exosome complex component RRP46